jgi:hypothetical protein
MAKFVPVFGKRMVPHPLTCARTRSLVKNIDVAEGLIRLNAPHRIIMTPREHLCPYRSWERMPDSLHCRWFPKSGMEDIDWLMGAHKARCIIRT